MNAAKTTTNALERKDNGALCLHCGLPVPEYRKIRSVGNDFCCSGCETVYEIISGNNLSYYYTLQSAAGNAGIPAAPPATEKELSWFDSPEFQELHVRFYKEEDKSLGSIELFLEGVHCPACVWLLERVPELLPGVRSVRVDLARSTAEVCYFPDEIGLSQLASGLTRFGYRPHPFRGRNHAELRRKAESALLSALGIAGACAGNVMLISICLYTGTFGTEDGDYQELFRWASLIISTPAVFWSGRIFYKRALAALRIKQVHLDVPISLGVLSAYAGSLINTIRGAGEIYFDSVCVILFLLLTSRFLQFRAQHKANEKAELLFTLLPSQVHVFENGIIRDCALEEIEVGQVLEVRGGETVPVDGIVLSGESLLDCSVLTGESVPIEVKKGNTLHAGMQNTTSPLLIEVRSTGEQTRIGRLAQLASDMQKSKPAVLHLVDRASKWFVSLVLILAVMAFFIGLQSSLEEAFERLIALLIISCPCALGMATPLALSVALGNAARTGIHLRSTSAIEMISKCKTIVFDKTGTLTKGKFEIHKWWGSLDVRSYVYAIEKHSSHIIARSLVTLLKEQESDIQVENISEELGRGISGTANGHEVHIGSATYINGEGIEISSEASSVIEYCSREGLTPIIVAIDLSIKAVIGLGDPLQEGTIELVESLRRAGYNMYLLSGDTKKVVNRTAGILGIEPQNSFGESSPEEKVEKIKDLEKNGPLILFGDGTNDAAALATATIGIAAHGGAETSFLIADGFLSRPDIRLIERLIKGSIDSMLVVRRGLLSSLFFNLAGCTLAVFGYVSPLVAALLMPISSLIVVILAFSQRSFLKVR